MAPSCIVCNRTSWRYRQLSFFRFPKDENRCLLWKANVKNPNLNNCNSEYCYEYVRICSLHFEKSMFSSMQGNRLKRYAVPTIFEVKSVPYKKKGRNRDKDPTKNVEDTESKKVTEQHTLNTKHTYKQRRKLNRNVSLTNTSGTTTDDENMKTQQHENTVLLTESLLMISEKQEVTIENDTEESEKAAEQLTLNAIRCRRYRQRKKLKKNIPLVSTSDTIADNAGSSFEIVPSKNALYCQRYRNKKKIQQRENTLLTTYPSLIINEKQGAMVENDKEAVDAGSSFEIAPSKNALYCRRYRKKKKIQQQENTLLMTGSSLLINEKPEATVEKNKEVDDGSYFETVPKNTLHCQRYQNKKKIQQWENTLFITYSSLINEKQEATEEKNKEGAEVHNASLGSNRSTEDSKPLLCQTNEREQTKRQLDDYDLTNNKKLKWLQCYYPAANNSVSTHNIKEEEDLYDLPEYIKVDENLDVQRVSPSQLEIEIVPMECITQKVNLCVHPGNIKEEDTVDDQPAISKKEENLFVQPASFIKQEVEIDVKEDIIEEDSPYYLPENIKGEENLCVQLVPSVEHEIEIGNTNGEENL